MPGNCVFRWLLLALFIWVHLAAENDHCAGNMNSMGDGRCDQENNNAECGYDGGDCCRCTCADGLDTTCGAIGFDCRDPEAPDEIYDCQAEPRFADPCPADVRREWVIRDTASARALAKAMLQCPGLTFAAEWMGSVSTSRTINVLHGTTLEISGSFQEIPNAIIGEGSNRLFTVLNATLNLTNVQVGSGSAVVGGAIAASSSRLYFDRTAFVDNVALADGGAIYATRGSKATCIGQTTFFRNRGGSSGGAIYIDDGSTILWSNSTSFHENFAGSVGGALSLRKSSSASWRAPALFTGNQASSGGALYATGYSSVAWGARMDFHENRANSSGGALFVSSGSFASWTGNTTFSKNTAKEDGGAVYVHGGCDRIYPSRLSVAGVSTFSFNDVWGRGGGIAMLGSVSVVFRTEDVTFHGNVARHAGGALFVSDVGKGLEVHGVAFTWNEALFGAGVYILDSGRVDLGEDDRRVQSLVTFDRCYFTENMAHETGGALQSLMGSTLIANSVFEQNGALSGGALHLGGASTVRNCTFVKNLSLMNQGPALFTRRRREVNVSTSSFIDNTGWCDRGQFLEYINTSEEPRSSALLSMGIVTPIGWVYPLNFGYQGAPSCHDCYFPPKLPACSPALDHTSSSGDSTTIQTLVVHPGFWRASNTSRDIIPCYHGEACSGGMTGSPDFCSDGYEGPALTVLDPPSPDADPDAADADAGADADGPFLTVCSRCSNGYRARGYFACSNCPYKVPAAVVAVMSVMAIFVLAILVPMMLSNWESEATDVRGLGVLAPWKRRLHSLKVVIVSWQALTQFASTVRVVYPLFYQGLLDSLDVVNFDLGWIFSSWCLIDLWFHERLLVATIGPPIVLIILATMKGACTSMYCGSEETAARPARAYHALVISLLLLVYAPVSSTLFQTFACDELYDGRSYLRADRRIDCDSLEHKAFQIYAAFMFFPYTIGIPLLYAALLLSNRSVLVDVRARETDGLAKSTESLWRVYKAHRFYFDLVECARRLFFAGILNFVFPGTAAQLAVAILVAIGFVGVTEALDPYESPLDAMVSRLGHAVLCTSMVWALVLKVDVSGSGLDWEWIMIGWAVVILHMVMVSPFVMSVVVTTRRHARERGSRSGSRTTYRRLDSSAVSEVELGALNDETRNDNEIVGRIGSSTGQVVRRR